MICNYSALLYFACIPNGCPHIFESNHTECSQGQILLGQWLFPHVRLSLISKCFFQTRKGDYERRKNMSFIFTIQLPAIKGDV